MSNLKFKSITYFRHNCGYFSCCYEMLRVAMTLLFWNSDSHGGHFHS